MLTILVSLLQPAPVVQAETQRQISKVQAVLAAMSPEERVGKLFLVTFQGMETHDQTHIYDLIANHHVGGVVLLAGNDNFAPDPNTILQSAHELTSELQTIESEKERPFDDGATCRPLEATPRLTLKPEP